MGASQSTSDNVTVVRLLPGAVRRAGLRSDATLRECVWGAGQPGRGAREAAVQRLAGPGERLAQPAGARPLRRLLPLAMLRLSSLLAGKRRRPGARGRGVSSARAPPAGLVYTQAGDACATTRSSRRAQRTASRAATPEAGRGFQRRAPRLLGSPCKPAPRQHARSLRCPTPRRSSPAIVAAYEAGKADAEQEARRHASALARDLAAAEAAAHIVAAEEHAAASAAEEVRSAVATGKPPLRKVPCETYRERVVACYRYQREQAESTGEALSVLSLRCAGDVENLERCAHVEIKRHMHPDRR